MLKAIKRGKYYHAIGHVNGERFRQSLKLTSKRLAELKVAEMNSEIERGIMGFTLHRKLLSEFLKEFKESFKIQSMSASSVRRYNTVFMHFFKYLEAEGIEDPPLNNLKKELFEKYIITRLDQGANPATVHLELDLLRAFFYEALRKKFISENPVARIKRPRLRSEIRKVFTPEHVHLIIDYCFKRDGLRDYYSVFLTLYHTAMRFGELSNLEWSDVDLDRRLVMIQNKPFWSTKTTQCRTIPINDLLYQELFVKSINKGPGWVFPDEYGGQLKQQNVFDVLKKVLKVLKIDFGNLHMFRHSAATHMLQAGVSLKDVKEYLGHSRIQTTEKYLHLLPRSLENAAAKLEEIAAKLTQSKNPTEKPDFIREPKFKY